MEQLQQKVNELEQRIQQLEKGNLITDEFVYNLVRRGFIRIINFLDFSGGVSGNPLTNAITESVDRRFSLHLERQPIEVFIRAGSKEFTIVGGGNPFENYTGAVILYSTGSAPAPFYSGGVYFVTDVGSNYVELDNQTATDSGVGTHYIDFM